MSDMREFITFVAISGFAAALNFAVRIPINLVTSFELAIILAYAIAMTTAFFLNRRFAFRALDGDWRQQYRRFFLINMVALLQVFIVSVGLAHFVFPAIGFTWHADAVAHAIGLGSPILTSFLGHKKYTFADEATAAESGDERRG